MPGKHSLETNLELTRADHGNLVVTNECLLMVTKADHGNLVVTNECLLMVLYSAM